MKRIWKWLGNNYEPVQAMAAIFAALLAVAAVIGLKWEVDSSARLQAEQSAREIYREYLNISVSKPEFAQPEYCAIAASPQFASYESYISYMLYAGEQVLILGDGWADVMEGEIGRHLPYLCSAEFPPEGYDPAIIAVVEKARGGKCEAIPACP